MALQNSGWLGRRYGLFDDWKKVFRDTMMQALRVAGWHRESGTCITCGDCEDGSAKYKVINVHSPGRLDLIKMADRYSI